MKTRERDSDQIALIKRNTKFFYTTIALKQDKWVRKQQYK